MPIWGSLSISPSVHILCQQRFWCAFLRVGGERLKCHHFCRRASISKQYCCDKGRDSEFVCVGKEMCAIWLSVHLFESVPHLV